MLLGIFVLKFKHTPLIGIDHMGILIFVIPFLIPPIGQMHMPMQEILWLVLLHQGPENLKPLVAQIPPVIQLVCRRMGY